MFVFFDRSFRNGVKRKPTSKPRGAEKENGPINAKRADVAVYTVSPSFVSVLYCAPAISPG